MSLEFFRKCIQQQIDKGDYREKGRLYEEGVHTIGEFIAAVFAIDTDEGAKSFYEGHVEHLKGMVDLNDDPARVARSNIGWCFGEGMSDKQTAMWVRVCKAAHPVFGAVMPTAEQAFAAGVAMGKTAKQ